jgi:hypothetical protein
LTKSGSRLARLDAKVLGRLFSSGADSSRATSPDELAAPKSAASSRTHRLDDAADLPDDRSFNALPKSWKSAVGALVAEACVALVIGVWVGHPWLALATAFWALPVFVLFVPIGAKWRRLDEIVLGVGGPDEARRGALFDRVLAGAIAVAILVTILLALLT